MKVQISSDQLESSDQEKIICKIINSQQNLVKHVWFKSQHCFCWRFKAIVITSEFRFTRDLPLKGSDMIACFNKFEVCSQWKQFSVPE